MRENETKEKKEHFKVAIIWLPTWITHQTCGRKVALRLVSHYLVWKWSSPKSYIYKINTWSGISFHGLSFGLLPLSILYQSNIWMIRRKGDLHELQMVLGASSNLWMEPLSYSFDVTTIYSNNDERIRLAFVTWYFKRGSVNNSYEWIL